MLDQLNNDKKFSKLISKHVIDIMSHMFENNYHFGVLCRIDHVTFAPDLSDELKAEFRPLTLFFLSGYTFESARIDSDYLYFEAGFGSSDQGSLVSVPLQDVIQIILDETPIFVNSTSKFSPTVEKELPEESGARENSFAALMANPENQKLAKKKK
jgi:hypothetical protein